ncbi:MAG: M48 family metallopeptidase [Spirochaetes bacterium]|nr:M48 family metallopeptidase [Spirochaetota bacterium]
MDSTMIRTLFFTFLFLETIYELCLTLLNIRHVKQHAKEVPPLFRKTIDEDTYRKTVSYTIDKNRFSLISQLLSTVFILVLVASGFLGILDEWVQFTGWHLYLQGILFLVLLSLLVRIVSLPLTLYQQFVLEERYGFNRMTGKLFLSDLGKGLVVQLILMTPLLLGLFWFMDEAGRYWWIWAFLFVTLFQLVVTLLYPLVIAPLFNKFTPLSEGSLKEKVLALAEKLGFQTRGIFVMDGSKRSRHSNAYFTGLGKVKRIVLFDTLTQTLSEEETCSVLAHELGHEKQKHILKMFLVSSVFLFFGFLIVDALLLYEPLYRAFTFQRPSYHGILTILSLCVGPFTFFLNPLINGLSRRFEYQADRFVVERAGLGEALASALLTLSKENLTNLTPHPWYSFYHYSHPTLGERLQALRKGTVA